MNNEQALEILEHNWTKLVNPDCTDEELGQALNLAIEALKENASLKKENASLKKHFKIMTNNMEDN